MDEARPGSKSQRSPLEFSSPASKPERLESERGTLDSIARNRSAAAALRFRDEYSGFANGIFVYELGSVRAWFDAGDSDPEEQLLAVPPGRGSPDLFS
jgi:hypothetical protein